MALLPHSRSTRFHFLSDDALCTDHLGRRVVADIEGDGICAVECAKAPLLFLRGDELLTSFQGPFEGPLTVIATDSGEVSLGIVQSGPEPNLTPSHTALSSISGRGWIISATGPLRIDDEHEPRPTPSKNFPIPFFRTACADLLSVALDGPPESTVDVLEIWDSEALQAREWKVQNFSAVTRLYSTFEDETELECPIASHLNAAHWSVSIPPDNAGIRIRKTYDRFHGRQRARVFIDGQFAGWWYAPVENRLHRWGVTDFGVSPAFTFGKSRVRITIDPPAGSPLWSVSRIEVSVLLPAQPTPNP